MCYLNLAKTMKTHSDIYIVDLPGWGISDSPARFLKIDAMHEYYAQVIAEVYCYLRQRSSSRLDVLAHSLGAYLTIQSIKIKRHAPVFEKETKIVLISTPGLTPKMSAYDWFWGWLITYSFPEKLMKKSPSQIWHCIRWFNINANPLDWFHTIALFNPEGEGYEVLARHMKVSYGKRPIWNYLCLNDLIQIAPYFKITMVWGDNDTLVSIKENPRILEQLQEAGIQNVFLMDSGHSLVSDDYKQIADIFMG